MTALVRTDKAKFVSTAWSMNVEGQDCVIGFDATVKTVIRAARGKLALGEEIVRLRSVYIVASVNAQLMQMISDFPTSSDSLNIPPAPRRTGRIAGHTQWRSAFASHPVLPAFFTVVFCHSSIPAATVQWVPVDELL
jgi:hypothetical protein